MILLFKKIINSNVIYGGTNKYDCVNEVYMRFSLFTTNSTEFVVDAEFVPITTAKMLSVWEYVPFGLFTVDGI